MASPLAAAQEDLTMLGNFIRRAVSAFARSKTGGRRRPVRRRRSAEEQLVRGAVRTARKKL